MNIKIDLENDIMIINKKSNIFFIKLDNIWYIEKFGNKTIIKTSNEEFEIRLSLKDFINILPDYFMKSHRSYIINTKKILKLQYIKNDSYKVFYDNNELDYAFSNKKNIKAIMGY